MKTVLITGSDRGLGKSLAFLFAKKGFNIIITYCNDYNRALDLKEDISNKYKVNVDIIKLDLKSEEDIEKVFKNKIDVLINNASISMDNEILLKTKEEFMNVLEVNLVGTFLMCKNAINNGIKDIINISSTDSVDTFSSLNIDYSASKAGINIITKTISLSFPRVRIFSVLPNWIDTETILDMNPIYLKEELDRVGQKKLLDKDKVAEKIYDLYCDKNIKSGELIRIDEGDIND